MRFTWPCFSDLTMEIVRYSLIGPQSHAVLADILEAATECDVRDFGPSLVEKKELWKCVCLALLISLFQEKSRSHPSSLWWPEHCRDENKMNLHKQQAEVYQTLKGLLFVLSVEIIHTHCASCVSIWLCDVFRCLFLRRASPRNSAGLDCRWPQVDLTIKEG